jgi:D-alanyl-D-alanine-carboxypeptidase/D-alanyl-D-alanine-endopeptidase
MINTSICLGSACRIIRCAAIAVVMFASFTWSGMQAAQADPFLDEVVGFTGQVLYLERKVPALVMGAVRNGEISVRGFGERAGKGSKAPDGDTFLNIGSMTKTFTGAVLAHLAASNTVQLTQPLSKSWPELATNAKAGVGHIRLIDLATQSGGLPRDWPQEPGPDPTAWLQKEPLLFKPGTSVLYSNFGFNLLALGLSKAANTPYPTLLKRYITDPLKMQDTGYVLSEEQKQRLMQGHGFDGEPVPAVPVDSFNVGGGGLASTPNDLLRWVQWHLDHFGENGAEARRLDHALYLIRDGLETVSGMDESGHMDAIALAWVAMMPEGDRPFILQKAGGQQGIFSYLAFAPTRGVAVFVAINTMDFAAAMAMAEVANDLIATLAPR